MTIRRIEAGPRMSQAVVHGNTVYLAGQVGDGDTVAAQTASCLAEVDRLLAAAGTDKSKILQAIIWLDDMANFAEMNSVWDKWVDGAEHAGARHRRGQARRAEVQGRDHHHRRDLSRGAKDGAGATPLCRFRPRPRALHPDDGAKRATSRWLSPG